MNQKLLDEEYLSYYSSETKSTSVISNFFDREYECGGSCYCEDGSTRRNTANILNRGIFITLSAFSITMAYSIAKDTFQNNCENSFSNICAKSSIESEVGECEEITNKEEEEEEEIVDDDSRRTYDCFGICTKNKNLRWHDDDTKIEDYDSLWKDEVRPCEEYEISGMITVNPGESGSPNYRAKEKFYQEYLSQFCVTQSTIEVQSPTSENDKDYRIMTVGNDDEISCFKFRYTNECVAHHELKGITCKLIRVE